jgi:CheY-like chemotaxis protein
MIAPVKLIRNVLLVEDNEASRVLMREAFEAASFEGQLDMVENGHEVMRFLKSEGRFARSPRPDLILLDLNLPGKSGAEIMSEIREDERFRDISIVILTGSNAANDIAVCSKFRCKYLLKPSRFHELVELVRTLPEFC